MAMGVVHILNKLRSTLYLKFLTLYIFEEHKAISNNVESFKKHEETFTFRDNPKIFLTAVRSEQFQKC